MSGGTIPGAPAHATDASVIEDGNENLDDNSPADKTPENDLNDILEEAIGWDDRPPARRCDKVTTRLSCEGLLR